jgi:hypothetical protein
MSGSRTGDRHAEDRQRLEDYAAATSAGNGETGETSS